MGLARKQLWDNPARNVIVQDGVGDQQRTIGLRETKDRRTCGSWTGVFDDSRRRVGQYFINLFRRNAVPLDMLHVPSIPLRYRWNHLVLLYNIFSERQKRTAAGGAGGLRPCTDDLPPGNLCDP